MEKSLKLLSQGFESSCYATKEFNTFFNTFKKEFTNELKTVNATEIEFRKGHFCLTGFCRVNGKGYYFSLSDVRGSETQYDIAMMYRTARDNKDYTGGSNCWVNIRIGMIDVMRLG